MNTISGVYKITNTITGDFYIGSSKNVKRRWTYHKCKSSWERHPNNPMYLDMKDYGIDNFDFQILEEAEVGKLKEKEQQFIETLKPTYNQMNANGLNIERRKEYNKEYEKSDKYKEYQKEYKKSDKYKEYEKSDNRKKYKKQYNNKLCLYNGETLTLNALSARFWRQGLSNPTKEAKKYLLEEKEPNIVKM